MSNCHSHYQPKSVTIHTRQLGLRNWGWRLCGYFFEEIEHGSGCRTKAIARAEAGVAKLKYLASVKVVKVKVRLEKNA